MTESASFFAELRRRHVIRAAVAHVIVAWLFIQVADVVLPYLGIVDEPVRWALVVSVATFPITLIVAWFVEHPWHRNTGSRVAIDVAVLGIIAVVAAIWTLRNLPQVVHTRTSVVIMPFEHSGDEQEQGLSRAIAYEVNSLLMKSKSIDVIGFQSAASTALTGLGTIGIADRLKVQHVVAGAISLANDSMRINVVLSNASGKTIWETVIEDRTENLFAVQEKIALAVERRLGAGESTVPVKQVSAGRCPMPNHPVALEKYYEARYFIEMRTDSPESQQQIRDAILIYKELIEQYPDFAQAKSGLAWAYLYQQNYDPDNSLSGEALDPLGKSLAERALEICPALGEAMHLLPNEFDHQNPWIGQHQQLQAFIEMQPDQIENYQTLAEHYRNTGLIDRAIELAEKTYAMNPLSVRAIKNLASLYQYDGRFDEAIELYDLATELGSTGPNFARMMQGIDACGIDVDCRMSIMGPMMGPMAEPMRLIMTAPATTAGAGVPVATALSVFSQAPANTVNILSVLACEYEHLGPELYFSLWQSNEALGENKAYWFWPNAWLPECADIWADARFDGITESEGFSEYWEAVGYPTQLRQK